MNIVTHALSSFILWIFRLACITLSCSLSLSFSTGQRRKTYETRFGTHRLNFLDFSFQFLVFVVVLGILSASGDTSRVWF